MIKFSILVPVYNVEQFIAECIESVLNQTYSNFELLLVDDGTSDRSGIICDQYANQDSRIVVYHKENKGLIQTRRYAIERAGGDYYVFLDSDDKLKKNALEVLAQTIEKYKCDTVIFGFERFCEGKVLSQTYDTEEVYLNKKPEIYRKVFFEKDKNALWRKAVKSDVFMGLDYSPYYHIRMGEDLLQSLEIYKNSKSIAFISDVLYEYRMNLQSMTHTSKITDIDFTVRKKTLEFIQSENAFSTDDFNHYRDFCIGLLVNTVIKIAELDESSRLKKLRFEEIRSDPYYQDFLKKGLSNRKPENIKTAVLYYIFKKTWDGLLIILIKSRKLFIKDMAKI